MQFETGLFPCLCALLLSVAAFKQTNVKSCVRARNVVMPSKLSVFLCNFSVPKIMKGRRVTSGTSAAE